MLYQSWTTDKYCAFFDHCVVKTGTATMLFIETGLPIAKFDLFMKVY